MSETDQVRVAVFGVAAVGKSCLSIRFVQEYFAEEYEPTIESNYRKTLQVDNKTYMIDIFDSAGMENLSSLKPIAIRQRDCFILIYSVEDNESFDAIQRYYDEILRIKEASTVPCILCANKQDLPEDKHNVDNSEGQQLAKKLHAIFLPTSAKTGQNIKKVMEEAVREVVKTRKPEKTEKKKKGGLCLLI